MSGSGSEGLAVVFEIPNVWCWAFLKGLGATGTCNASNVPGPGEAKDALLGRMRPTADAVGT